MSSPPGAHVPWVLRHPFSVEHVTLMVRMSSANRVIFTRDGEVRRVTLMASAAIPMPAVVRVETNAARRAGGRMLRTISNMLRRAPFSIIYNLAHV